MRCAAVNPSKIRSIGNRKQTLRVLQLPRRVHCEFLLVFAQLPSADAKLPEATTDFFAFHGAEQVSSCGR